MFYNLNKHKWDLVKALNVIMEPAKVNAIMSMSDELFEEYKIALLKAGKIKILKH